MEITGSACMTRSPTWIRALGRHRYNDERTVDVGAVDVEAVDVITCVQNAATVTPCWRAWSGTCATNAAWPRGSSVLTVALAASSGVMWASIYAGSIPTSASTSSTRPDEVPSDTLVFSMFLPRFVTRTSTALFYRSSCPCSHLASRLSSHDIYETMLYVTC